MTTPIDRAAEAVSGALAPLLGQSPTGPDETDYEVARAVFESIPDEWLAAAICKAVTGKEWGRPHPAAAKPWLDAADALKAALLIGGES